MSKSLFNRDCLQKEIHKKFQHLKLELSRMTFNERPSQIQVKTRQSLHLTQSVIEETAISIGFYKNIR